MWFDNVARFVQRVRERSGVKERVALAATRIDLETRVGSARIVPEFDDFAVAIQILIQFHLAPVVDAKVVADIGVLASKGEIRVAYGLQQDPLDPFPVCVQHFDNGVQGRRRAGRVDLQNPLFVCRRGESEQVNVLTISF